MNTITEAQSLRLLESFVVDNLQLGQLEDSPSEFNLFEAIGATRRELRHSDFLAFLMDPKAKHRLGDYFVKTLFKRVLRGAVNQGVGAIDVDVADLSDVVVEREKYQIDVLLWSEHSRLVLAIENKVDSAEHGDQLERYANTLDHEFPDYRKALIFLTADGDDASDPSRWLAMSYSVLKDAVQTVLDSRGTSLIPAVRVALEHYAAVIGRHIVTDSKIATLCQRIYREHKEALDLIFEHRPDLQLEMKGILEGEIVSRSGFRLDHCTKSAVRFLPDAWDSDPREAAGEGWTPTRRVLLFELANSVDCLRLKLIIGPAKSNDSAAAAFRQDVFNCSQQFRSDFPGGMTTLYPRFTSVWSKELVKRKDYSEQPENVPAKAKEAIQRVFANDIPQIVRRIQSIMPLQ